MNNGKHSNSVTNDGEPRPASLGVVTVRTEKLASTYANVVLANSTRDEVVLGFGLNKDWDRREPEHEVLLLKRIILTPQGARRFGERLAQVLAEYEKRHGVLGGGPEAPPQPGAEHS